MRVVIADGPPTPTRVAAALALARRPGMADEVRILPAGAPFDGPTDDTGVPVVRLTDHFTAAQIIDWVGFGLRLADAAAGPPPAVVIDTSNLALAGPAAFAGGSVELVLAAGQALFWHPEPPPLLHFAPARLRPFHLREWARLLAGGPLGPTPPGLPDPTAEGLGETLAAAERERYRHRPWVRFRGKLGAKLRARLPRLPWR